MASPKRSPGYTGKQVLISTPIEAVLAIVLFGIFSNLEQVGEKNTLYPWVKGVPLLENCLLIPANLLFSTVMGIMVGGVASIYIDWRSHQKTDFIWYRVNKNPQMGKCQRHFCLRCFGTNCHDHRLIRFEHRRPGVRAVGAVLHDDVPLHEPVHPAVLGRAGGVRREHHGVQDGQP
jgi:hypothetical protein